ncbi:hypothetical protein B0H17DRAFT_445330 [Mycena rosella]|uniref:Uncharacterized protein n=1 Tax=Mycena rosella TaxID=1033263 RepID=A0AAD7DPL0_MYCRO|nr:hypothetical protein B0H17DRAFT_445330 [Mycena rosella]
MSAQWCLEECLSCSRVFVCLSPPSSCSRSPHPQDGHSNYCSADCEAAATPPHEEESDDEYDDPLDSASYSSWHRVSVWAQNVTPTPPLPHPIYTSPSKRILTPQHPTSCLTSDSLVSSKPHPSPPRPARVSPTATESLVASSAGPTSPVSLGSLVRSWAPRPHLPRLTTANFTVFAKAHPTAALAPLPSDETTSDGDVSPVWWATAAEPESPSIPPSGRFFIQRRTPASRGRKAARAVT